MGSRRIVEKFVIYLRVRWVWIRCGLGVRMHCVMWRHRLQIHHTR